MRFRCFVIKQQFNLLSKIQNQSFKSQMKSRSDTMFFWDNERRIDMVLAYEDDEEDDEDEEEVKLVIVQKYLVILKYNFWYLYSGLGTILRK